VKAIVTGAGGYIGRILCKILHESGWNVVALDIDNKPLDIISNYVSRAYNNKPTGYGNINFWKAKQNKVDVIFHLGANSLLGPSVTNPLTYFKNNNSHLTEMLTGIVEGVNQKTPIVFASSAAVYGDVGTSHLIREDLAGNPINPYGWTKWFGEKLLEAVCAAYGARAMAMRFFNVAGSYGELGQDVDQPHILTKMSMASINKSEFKIFGSDYNTYDRTCVRDYIHVEDVCRTLIAAANHIILTEYGYFDTFNVGNGNACHSSNKELVKMFQQHFPLTYSISEERSGDPAYLLADTFKTITQLNYRPKHNLSDIIKSHYRHIEELNYEH